MAHTIAARNEDHRHGRNLRHERGVVIRASHDPARCKRFFCAGALDGVENRRRGDGWLARIQHARINLYLSLCRNLLGDILNAGEHAITSLSVGVAQIHAEPDMVWNAVDCPRMSLSDADRRYCVEG